MAPFGKQLVFGSRALVGPKFAVFWRTHSEHAVVVDHDVNVENLVLS